MLFDAPQKAKPGACIVQAFLKSQPDKKLGQFKQFPIH